MHFASALSNDPHDFGMGNRRSDFQRFLIEGLRTSAGRRERGLGRNNHLQPFIVPGIGVHLDFQRIDLQRVRTFARVVPSVLLLARPMEITELPNELRVFASFQPQASELDVRLEP